MEESTQSTKTENPQFPPPSSGTVRDVRTLPFIPEEVIEKFLELELTIPQSGNLRDNSTNEIKTFISNCYPALVVGQTVLYVNTPLNPKYQTRIICPNN